MTVKEEIKEEKEFFPGGITLFQGKKGFAPGKIRFIPGKKEYFPGKIRFAPGKLKYFQGKIKFAPGQTGFAPGKTGDFPCKTKNPAKNEKIAGHIVDRFHKIKKGGKYAIKFSQK